MPRLRVSKECTFTASHRHPPNEHLVHEHVFRLLVTIEGTQDEHGLVMNFDGLKAVIEQTVISELDQRYLNDRFTPCTLEHVVMWIWDALLAVLPTLAEITLWINPESSITYAGL